MATRLWSVGAPLDEARVGLLRSRTLVDNHRHYVANSSAYRALAEERGLTGRVELADLRTELLVSDDYFKSYHVDWLDHDLGALTRWLTRISTLDVPSVTAADVDTWRVELKRHGVVVTFSTGTSGKPSLVPRDRRTLAALRAGCGVRLPWHVDGGAHDCLLLTDQGMGRGIQSGAAGLAATAARVHHLRPGQRGLTADAAESPPIGPEEWDRAIAFLGSERPVILYGPPARLSTLLARMVETQRSVRLAPDSCVVTGGGWKHAAAGHGLAALFCAAGELLGVPPSRCVDTYSTSELNTVFLSCEHGRYHVPPAVEVLVVDELLRPTTGAGRLAVLDPFAWSYPGFVVGGDHVRMAADPCDCGRPGPALLGPIVRAQGMPERGCGVVGVG